MKGGPKRRPWPVGIPHCEKKKKKKEKEGRTRRLGQALLGSTGSLRKKLWGKKGCFEGATTRNALTRKGRGKKTGVAMSAKSGGKESRNRRKMVATRRSKKGKIFLVSAGAKVPIAIQESRGRGKDKLGGQQEPKEKQKENEGGSARSSRLASWERAERGTPLAMWVIGSRKGRVQEEGSGVNGESLSGGRRPQTNINLVLAKGGGGLADR